MSRRAVRTNTGATYDVVVEAGLLARLGSEAAGRLPDVRRWVVIADSTVADLYGARAIDALAAATARAEISGAGAHGGSAGPADGRAAPPELVTFPAGEANKTRDEWARLTDELFSRTVGRDSAIIALGGGVTGDLAGFVAATYMRGLPVIQVPTTLLAMVDASIGGKTGVDSPQGKNLIGAFHPPVAVLADPATLGTLDPRELRGGLAEALKHGAIADIAYFERMVSGAERLLSGDAAGLGEVVTRSVEIKADVVEADPLEAGQRAVLNFGHTIAHALELVSGFEVPHGEAVAIGMCVEARLGESLGITQRGTARRLQDGLRRLGLPTTSPAELDTEAVVRATQLDKKSRGGAARYVLLERLGSVARSADGGWTHAVDSAAIREVLSGSGEDTLV